MLGKVFMTRSCTGPEPGRRSGNPCLACAFTFTSQPNGQCADVTPGDGHGSCATCTAGGVCGP